MREVEDDDPGLCGNWLYMVLIYPEVVQQCETKGCSENGALQPPLRGILDVSVNAIENGLQCKLANALLFGISGCCC